MMSGIRESEHLRITCTRTVQQSHTREQRGQDVEVVKAKGVDDRSSSAGRPVVTVLSTLHARAGNRRRVAPAVLHLPRPRATQYVFKMDSVRDIS